MTTNTPASTTGQSNDVRTIGLVLLIPGAIFDLALPAWLLTKGFTPEAYDGPPGTSSPARPS